MTFPTHPYTSGGQPILNERTLTHTVLPPTKQQVCHARSEKLPTLLFKALFYIAVVVHAISCMYIAWISVKSISRLEANRLVGAVFTLIASGGLTGFFWSVTTMLFIWMPFCPASGGPTYESQICSTSPIWTGIVGYLWIPVFLVAVVYWSLFNPPRGPGDDLVDAQEKRIE